MELLVKELFHGGFGTLNVGETTAGRDISEEMKLQLIKDHPEWFEVVEDEAPADKVVVSTPEDSLVIETPEAKMPKSRKK